MKLIVNADDFGMSRGVNYGIYDAHIKGIVTSTTLMITMPEVKHAKKLAKTAKTLKIGLHLNITLGKPLTRCKSILKRDGTFYKPKEHPDTEGFSEEEIYQEFLAQIKLFIKIMKQKPTHLDSHLYAHQIYDKARSAAVRLAIEYDIPIRDIQIDNFKEVTFMDWFKIKDNSDMFEVFENKLKENTAMEICELMVHPAYIDDFLIEYSTYNLPRVDELKLLINSRIKELLKENRVELISYEDVRS